MRLFIMDVLYGLLTVVIVVLVFAFEGDFLLFCLGLAFSALYIVVWVFTSTFNMVW